MGHTVRYPTGSERTTVQACCRGCETAQSSLRSYCVRPRRPAGPAPSRRAESGGGARRSCSTAASAAGNLAGILHPQPGHRKQQHSHPPSRSTAASPAGDPGCLRGAIRGLRPPLQWSGVCMLGAEHGMAWMRVPAFSNGTMSPQGPLPGNSSLSYHRNSKIH